MNIDEVMLSTQHELEQLNNDYQLLVDMGQLDEAEALIDLIQQLRQTLEGLQRYAASN